MMQAKDYPTVGRWLIYGLHDLSDNSLRYIGKTHKRKEYRLAEHLLDAAEGATRPVHSRIRLLVLNGLKPEIFVLERVPPTADWRVAERAAIAKWRTNPPKLPYIHPPQTPKSTAVLIERIELLNIRSGG